MTEACGERNGTKCTDRQFDFYNTTRNPLTWVDHRELRQACKQTVAGPQRRFVASNHSQSYAGDASQRISGHPTDSPSAGDFGSGNQCYSTRVCDFSITHV